MNFLVDAQLPPALCTWLGQRGHEASHITDVLFGAAPDANIVDYVVTTGLILISKDEDFVALRFPERFPLLWLRCGNATNRALSAWLEPRWPEIERLLASGEKFVEVR